MTQPTLLTRPLLIHSLAAVMLCPAVFADSKIPPLFGKKNRPAKTVEAAPSKTAPPAGKTAPSKKSAPAVTPAAFIGLPWG